jgi:uncharacterized protein involved in cysteine biosynthesis
MVSHTSNFQASLKMNSVFEAVGKAIKSQLHPAMLGLLIMPWLVAGLVWGVALYFFWTPLTAWLTEALFGGGSGWLASLFGKWGSGSLGGAKGFASAAVALFFVLPLFFSTAMLLVAILAMPAVLSHLSKSSYSDIVRKGSFSLPISVWNSVKALLVFIPGYILTIPLWFVPVLGLLVPLLWWAWLNSRIMRFDSLVEHADAVERSSAIDRHGKEYGLIALVIGVLNYIPPLFLLTPVLSALAFGHFSLSSLRTARTQTLTPTPTPTRKVGLNPHE